MAKSHLKFAGSKRQSLKHIIPHFPTPDRFEVYLEGCVGGGSVFFKLEELGLLKGKEVVLNEYDQSLSELWDAVKHNPELLLEEYRRLAGLEDDVDLRTPIVNAKERYEVQRQLWNLGSSNVASELIDTSKLQTPARNFYLRWASFNGLWRENKSGEMNVPWNKQDVIKVPSLEKLQECSRALTDVAIMSWDINTLLEDILQEDDGAFFDDIPTHRILVYLDPPYLSGFTQYTADGWTENQARQLVQNAAQLADRGAHVLFSHSDVPIFREILQKEWPEGHIVSFSRRNILNSKGTGRGPKLELLILSKSLRP